MQREDKWRQKQKQQVQNGNSYKLTTTYINKWSQYYNVKEKEHLGMDIKSKSGDKNIYCIADGIVHTKGYNNANGNCVVIQYSVNGKKIYSFYAHLSKISVKQSQKISKGKKIGVIGSTGSSSTGVHLHFALTAQASTGVWSYGNKFSDSSNKTSYEGYTFYNPSYAINNGKLPTK